MLGGLLCCCGHLIGGGHLGTNPFFSIAGIFGELNPTGDGRAEFKNSPVGFHSISAPDMCRNDVNYAQFYLPF